MTQNINLSYTYLIPVFYFLITACIIFCGIVLCFYTKLLLVSKHLYPLYLSLYFVYIPELHRLGEDRKKAEKNRERIGKEREKDKDDKTLPLRDGDIGIGRKDIYYR